MSVSLVRTCSIRKCTRRGHRVVVSRCGFTNEWRSYGTTLCGAHARQERQYPGYVTEVSCRTDWQNEHITHVRPRPVADKPVCGRCYRPLRSADSIRRGYGKHCARIVRQESAKAEGFSASQVSAAIELLEDKGVLPLRGNRVFLTVSTDGTRIHRTTRDMCTCHAGIRGIRCYHSLSVQLLRLAA